MIISRERECLLQPLIALAYEFQFVKLELTTFVICNCYLDEAIPEPIQQPSVVYGVGSEHNRAKRLEKIARTLHLFMSIQN